MTRNTIMTSSQFLEMVLANTGEPLPGSVPQGFGDEMAELADMAPDAKPPAGLFARIEESLDAPTIPGIRTTAAQGSNWSDLGHGVWCKRMAAGPDGKTVVMLRCLPGAKILAHVHKGWEFALVLEGRYQIAGRVLNAGDSQFADANSHHPEIFSDTGCLLLVVG